MIQNPLYINKYRNKFRLYDIIQAKIPVPDPYQVINDPEQYKPIISMVLNNDIMNTLGKTHSYVKYFTLLANKIGATPMLNPPTAPIPTHDFTNNAAQLPANFNDIVKMAGPSQDPIN
jgi:hypothetical protein